MPSKKTRSVEELISHADTTLAAQLDPYVELADPSLYWKQDELWKAIGGTIGLRVMYENAGIFLTFVRLKCKEDPDNAGQACGLVTSAAIYLRLEILACLVEVGLKRFFPDLPRVQARSCARLYCELIHTIRAISEMS